MLKKIKYKQYNRQFIQFIPDNSPRNLEKFEKKKRFSDPEQVARSRAFNVAQRAIWLNPELEFFVTLTYARQHQNYDIILNDLKNFFTRNKVAYVAVVERHKSGNYHIHAICSQIDLVSLRKGKFSALKWHKGFSDVKHLSDFDSNFNSAMYILKYMFKSEKIGGRYVLKSRGFFSNVVKDVKYVGDSKFYKNELINHEIYSECYNAKKVIRTLNSVLGCDTIKILK